MTYLSFLTFLLDVRIGERMGFGVALTLIIVANQLMTVGLSPISNERLWLDKFVGWSFYFVLISVVESILISFLYFLREDRKKEELYNEGNITAKRKNGLADKNNFAVRGGPRDKEEPNNESNGTAKEKIGLADENHDSVDGAEGNNIAKKTIDFNSNKHIPPSSSSEFITAQKTFDFTDNRPLPSSSSKIKGFLYDVSLRKIDMICLVTVTVVYTVFIIGMVASNHAGLWLKNEPEWFDEESTVYKIGFDIPQ